jgi:Putative transmembrane protein (PGPGW).
MDELSPAVRKVIVGIVGGCVLMAGFALLFLPGPAFVVIPLGLAILATEFAWAKHYLDKAKGWVERSKEKYKRRRQQRRGTRAAVAK